MLGNEKRTKPIKANLEDTVYMDFCQLAEQEQRTQGDMLNHLIKLHLYGHSHRLPHCAHASHCPNRED